MRKASVANFIGPAIGIFLISMAAATAEAQAVHDASCTEVPEKIGCRCDPQGDGDPSNDGNAVSWGVPDQAAGGFMEGPLCSPISDCIDRPADSSILLAGSDAAADRITPDPVVCSNICPQGQTVNPTTLSCEIANPAYVCESTDDAMRIDPHGVSCSEGFSLSDTTESNCGQCVAECTGSGHVTYSLSNGDRFCGPASQCELIGGIRTGNLNCAGECTDPSHQKFNGPSAEMGDDFCAMPAECADTHTPNDSNVCAPRAAENCEDTVEIFAPDAGGTGGRCECAADHEPQEDAGGRCMACTGGMVSPGGSEACACPSGMLDIDGTCEVATDISTCTDTQFINPRTNRCDDCGTNEVPGDERTACVCAERHVNILDESEEGMDCRRECNSNQVRDDTDFSCRFPSDASECALLTLNPAEPIYDENEHDNCRVAADIDDCADGEIFDSGCSAPATGPECRRAKNRAYEGIDGSNCVTECPSGRPPDSSFVCRELTLDDCLDGQVLDRLRCANPDTGRECEGAKNTDYIGIDGSSCVTECPQTRPFLDPTSLSCRVALSIDDCDDGEAFDSVCGQPNTGHECRNAKNEDTYIGIDRTDCVAECPPERPILDQASFVCRIPAGIDDCANGEVFVSTCGRPSTGHECRDAKNEDTFIGIDGSTCVAECPPERPFLDAASLTCRMARDINDCLSTHKFVDGGNSLGGTCEPRTENDCAATGQIFAAAPDGEGGTCSRPPAPIESEGVSPVFLISAPMVLIGGYAMFGGLGYIDPVYDFNYSGKNGKVEWHATGGFNLRHGGLHSYVSAIRGQGNSISYVSGASYGTERFSLTYDATESDTEYLYDLGASVKTEFGLWTIAPTAASEFRYQREENAWKHESTAGVAAVWTAHRWKVSAHSDFAGAAQHALELKLRF